MPTLIKFPIHYICK